MTEEGFDSLDRATLATWRVANLFGWASAALFAALVIHQVADELGPRVWVYGGINSRPEDHFGTWQFWAPKYGLSAGISIIIAIVIGTIIGLKVWRRPVAVAAGVAGGYLLLAMLALELSLPTQMVDETGDFAPGSML